MYRKQITGLLKKNRRRSFNNDLSKHEQMKRKLQLKMLIKTELKTLQSKAHNLTVIHTWPLALTSSTLANLAMTSKGSLKPSLLSETSTSSTQQNINHNDQPETQSLSPSQSRRSAISNQNSIRDVFNSGLQAVQD